jgi:aspartyl-tRNA(Asn)/glutamyl-tRNA(Gln) amidotransferase subunit A
MYLNDIFTVPASMAGLPAISIPAAINKEGLPLGLHVVGPAFTEQTVLRIADVIETAAEFNVKPDVNNIISG